MSHSPQINAPKGFTLIEILVTVAIVSVLMAMLYGVSRKMVVDAQRAQCAANMREIWRGTLMYVGENNGYLPKDKRAGDMGPTQIKGIPTVGAVGAIARLLLPYVEDRVWFCPDPWNVKFTQTPGNDYGRIYRKRGETNWMSGAPYNGPTTDSLGTPKTLAEWDNLGKRYVFTCNAGPGPYPHNRRRINFLAMDGHVESVHYP